MGLIAKPPSWSFCTSNLTGTPANTSNGATFTIGTSSAFGAAVSVLSALTHDVEYLVIAVSNSFLSTTDARSSMQVLIDPAGGTTWDTTNPLIDGLTFGKLATGWTGASQGAGKIYHFPIWVKSGASIGVRAMTVSTAAVGAPRLIMWAYGGNENPSSWWCGQKVTTLGVTNATGTLVTPNASAGTFGSWTSVGSTLGAPAGAFQFNSQGPSGGADVQASYFVEMGAGSNRIGPTYALTSNTTENLAVTGDGLIFKSIASGTQMQARACGSIASQVATDVSIYAVH